MSKPKYTYDDQIFSDLHKDATGFRPRNHEYYDATPERKQQIWDYYCEELQRSQEIEAEQERVAHEKFENTIVQHMKDGLSRAEAIKKMVTDHPDLDETWDTEGYICFTFGISYRYEKEIYEAVYGKKVA